MDGSKNSQAVAINKTEFNDLFDIMTCETLINHILPLSPPSLDRNSSFKTAECSGARHHIYINKNILAWTRATERCHSCISGVLYVPESDAPASADVEERCFCRPALSLHINQSKWVYIARPLRKSLSWNLGSTLMVMFLFPFICRTLHGISHNCHSVHSQIWWRTIRGSDTAHRHRRSISPTNN